MNISFLTICNEEKKKRAIEWGRQVKLHTILSAIDINLEPKNRMIQPHLDIHIYSNTYVVCLYKFADIYLFIEFKYTNVN